LNRKKKGSKTNKRSNCKTEKMGGGQFKTQDEASLGKDSEQAVKKPLGFRKKRGRWEKSGKGGGTSIENKSMA